MASYSLQNVGSGDTRDKECNGHGVDVGRRQLAADLPDAGDVMPSITRSLYLRYRGAQGREEKHQPLHWGKSQCGGSDYLLAVFRNCLDRLTPLPALDR